jgi:ribosomal RNA-processing protein 9
LTAGKEGNIIKWDLHTGKKLATFYKVRPETTKGKGKQKSNTSVMGHCDEILGLAISGDEKLLASASRDKSVGIWDLEADKWVKGFSGHFAHKDAVSVSSRMLYDLQICELMQLRSRSPSKKAPNSCIQVHWIER